MLYANKSILAGEVPDIWKHASVREDREVNQDTITMYLNIKVKSEIRDTAKKWSNLARL